jgi:3D-(3,5/4)-trihydroxycyclohexane-1,2-dione acylhydrolase (decyclizing)
MVYAEDTRVTQKLLGLYGLKKPVRSYHDHNAEQTRPEVLEKLVQGHTIALVSDAGTPLISDPGYQLVRAVQAAGLRVVTVPGASSVISAVQLSGLPSDAEVIGAVQRQAGARDVVVCAAGGLPGELHKLWQAGAPGGYHMEYGFSCMGYEIAGGLGVKMADPTRHVTVMVGDGSYLMMNSEIATSIMLGMSLTIVVLDNRGYGCINRLQKGTGGAAFNNLLDDARHVNPSAIDFVAHAASMGAIAVKAKDIESLEAELAAARGADRPVVIVIDTDPGPSTEAGGSWWDVAVPEVSVRPTVQAARQKYEDGLRARRLAD